MHAVGNDVNAVVNVALKDMMCDVGEVIVFAPASMKRPYDNPDSISEDRWVCFPDSADTSPKQKNFILDWCKGKGFIGFLHLVESCVVFNDKTKDYMDKLESTMSALDYDVHLSTASDRCNYVFNKFCPRIAIDIDDIELKFNLNLPDKICFTSHSNVTYVTYNFKALGGNALKFDERFTIGMFFIIEFLARRRATKRED